MFDDPADTTRVSRPTSTFDAPKEASLVEIYGPNLGKRHIIDRDTFTIGREPNNCLVLDDDSVSRHHARLTVDKNTVSVEDNGSTNGSFVNDDEVAARELTNGDILKIGSVIFKFISGGNAEALYHEEIYRMTITDGLTGLANRRFLVEFLERELARTQRYGRPLSLAMFDVDHFKNVNDTYGHLAGDYVLRKIAIDLRGLVRREELLARYGGEEFALVMPETSLDKAAVFAEKIRSQVADTKFVFDGRKIPITISLGIASASQNALDPQSFFKTADDELYRAKREGRNRVCVAQAE